MKKNKMMRLASGLLVAVLITTSTISGTFAKYTTSGEAEDEARVAKFGVTVTATTEGIFAEKYEEAGDEGADEFSVVAATKVVAPGTSGSLAAFTITGDPEVDVKVTYTATADLGDNWVVGDDFYCPLVFTVGSETVDGSEYTSAAALEAAIAEKIDREIYYDTTEDFAEDDTFDVSWAWPFEVGTDEDTKAANNAKDTALGDAAADATTAEEEIRVKLTVECRVDQVD